MMNTKNTMPTWVPCGRSSGFACVVAHQGKSKGAENLSLNLDARGV